MSDFRVETHADHVVLTPLTDKARAFLAPHRGDGIDQGDGWELQAGYWPAFHAEITAQGLTIEEAP